LFEKSIFALSNENEDEETTEIPLMQYMDGTAKIKTTGGKNVASGKSISLTTKINAIAVTEGGQAGTEFESWNVARDDFMFTVEISDWPWSRTAAEDEEDGFSAFLDFNVEINTFGCDIYKEGNSNFVYELGDDARLLLTNRYFGFNEKTQVYQQRFMPEGYPKMAKADDYKYVFTFRFLRFKSKIFYDPPITYWDNRHGTFEVHGNYRQTIPVNFGLRGGVSLKNPFIKAVEKARTRVYPCSADDFDTLIYKIRTTVGEDPFRIMRDKDAEKMRIKEVLTRIKSWNNGDTLKVTFDMFTEQIATRTTAAVERPPSPRTFEHAATINTGAILPVPILDDTRTAGVDKPFSPSNYATFEHTTIKNTGTILPVLQVPIPDPVVVEPEQCYEILISARFDGSAREQEARDLKDELVTIGLDAHIVEAAAGRDFGTETHKYLYSMKTMIAFCFEDYGQKTISKYSTYWELKYAYDKDKRIIPIKRCTEWPPKPPIDHDDGEEGIIQNTIVFKNGLAYLDWSNKNWNPVECAKEVKEALQKRSK
jgi:hypothetical protein